MQIQWYGQSCFRIENKDISLLIDPFSKAIGMRPPRIHDQLLLYTHTHPDHCGLGESGADDFFVVRGPGEYESKGVYIRGIQSFHDASEGKERGLNTIYVIRLEDVTVCHLGDFGQAALTDQQVEDIGDCDILMVPVGGIGTINAKEAADVVTRLEPKIVIPMHYKVPGLTMELEGSEKFLKAIGLTPERVEKLKVNQKTLPSEEMKLVVFSL